MKTLTISPVEHLYLDDVADLIAYALWPDSEERYKSALEYLKPELEQAVNDGLLRTSHPITLGFIPPAVRPADPLDVLLNVSYTVPLRYRVVTVPNFIAYAATRDIAVVMEAPQQTTQSQAAPEQESTTSAPVVAVGVLDGEAWINKARERAAEIIKRQREKDLYPSQENIGDEIAREFRADGIVGTDGKPISGAYIKRHALNGISSAQGKQLSTRTGRGK